MARDLGVASVSVIGPREGLTGDGARLFKPQDRRLGIYVKSQNQHARP